MDYSGLDFRHPFQIPAFGEATVRGAFNVVAEILFSGPRQFATAFESARKAFSEAWLDYPGVSRILLWLFERGKKATVAEIVSAFSGLNFIRVIPQLREVPGVIWLNRDSGVIILSAELKSELGSLLGGSASPRVGAPRQDQADQASQEAQAFARAGAE